MGAALQRFGSGRPSDPGFEQLDVREIEVLRLPVDPAIELLHPERLIMEYGDGIAVDIGAFAFLRRSKPAPANGRAGRHRAERLVVGSTVSQPRRQWVRAIVRLASSRMTDSAKRPLTVAAEIKALLMFLDWADENGHCSALDSRDAAKKAIGGYVHWLREQVSLGILALNTAAIKQILVLAAIGDLLEVEDLDHGLPLLRIDKSSAQATEPPSDDAQSRVLALCEALFNGLATLVLECRPYPYWLPMPKFLGADGDGLWAFPSNKWCMPPHELRVRASLGRPFWVFDYANGRLADPLTIAPYYTVDPRKNTPLQVAQKAVDQARVSMESANADSRHHRRLGAALIAHNAFLVLFLANTAMNWSSVRELLWTGEFDVGAERQGFRTVKYRAQRRTVAFEIQAVFLPSFRRFLQVRAYLLGERVSDRLFVASDFVGRRIEPLKTKSLTNIVESLQRIDPTLPSIMSKAWRAGKSDWLLRTTDVATAAQVLQNTEFTVLQSYAAGSSTTHHDEMGMFFERLSGVVLDREVVMPSAVERAVGMCTAFGHPEAIGSPPVPVDCRGAEGCLFCEHFKVHADERDTRKLISCRYCIQQTAPLAGSQERFLALFGPIFDRIGAILSEVGKRAPGIVEQLEREVVEDGNLDPYWAGKLEMLLNLELVA